MGQYEPNDSREVTLKPSNVPGEPERTGPREGQTREPRSRKGETPQRTDHNPVEKDLARGSEPATRAAARNRR
jgi:hypothetical protein